MKKAGLITLVFVIALMMSGCFIFKKKCDCPKFGRAGQEYQVRQVRPS